MNKISKPVSQINFEEIIKLVDANELMNYFIIQAYIGNTDFPHNNLVMWKPRTENGKWRYILKDTDFGLDDGRLTHNTIAHYVSTDRNDQDRNLFSALLSYEPFKTEFYSRFAIYMGDILSPKATSHIIDSIRYLVEPEMLRHRSHWGGTQNLNNWNSMVDRLVNWCSRRNDYMYTYLQQRFGLFLAIPMIVETQENIEYNSGDIMINGIPIQNQSFNGKYFRSKEVNIHWNGDPEKVNGWMVTTTISGDQRSTTYLERDINYFIPSQCTNIQFTAIYSTENAIPVVLESTISCYTDNNQLMIKGLQGNSALSLYSVNGSLVFETKTTENELIIPLNEKGLYILKIKNKNQIIVEKIIIN